MSDKQSFSTRLLPKTLKRIQRFKREAECYSVGEAIERAFCLALLILDIEKSGGVVISPPSPSPDMAGSLVISALNHGGWLNEEREECDDTDTTSASMDAFP